MNWAQDAILGIKNLRIPHRNYERALSGTMSMLLASEPGEVICITGPSRAGKSSLAADLRNLIIGDQPLLPGIMPVVSLTAANCSSDGAFSTKTFMLRSLNAIEHPFYSPKQGNDVWDVDWFRLIDRTSEGTFRTAFENGLETRKTQYLFIDEVQHLQYARDGYGGAAAILDSWKCLASDKKVVLVVIGAYPLLNVLLHCPHLLGRKHQIHLARYYPTRDDLLVFEQILDAYSELLRLPPGIKSLRDWNELLYPDSLGCIGLLESWLREGLATADTEQSEVLSLEHLQASRKALVEREVIAEEIAQGEQMLKMDPDKNSPTKPAPGGTATGSQKTKRRRKPFQKKPRRYPVGGRY